MRELEILLSGERIGWLTETRKGARFAYDELVAERWPGRPLLSAALPVKRRPYSEGLTGAWFEGLLPEGERLDRICRELRCASGDYIGILAEIGWECAGAVSIVDPERSYPTASAPRELDEMALAEELLALPTYQRLDAGVARMSLGGYQEKLCVVARDVSIDSGMVTQAAFALPDAATMSTHILKPQPAHEYQGLIAAEAWALSAASAAARCARAALLDLEGAPLTLVVERFDRASVDGASCRIHQEDCCQAQGLAPVKKYASTMAPRGDDPTYAAMARILSSYAEHPDEELAEMLRQIVVNVALGNTDAHAKNYAFLYEKTSLPTLSPLYDVVPVVDVEPRARHLSLRIDGEIVADRVTRESLIRESMGWGLGRSTVEALIDEVLAALEAGIERASQIYPAAGARHAELAAARIARLS